MLELFSEALGYKVLSYDLVHHDFMLDGITYTSYPLNRYELAHKCKEWALKQNFKVDDEFSYGLEKGRAKLKQYQEFDICDVFGYKIGRTAESDWFDADSVPEAIFKACEWILEQKRIDDDKQ